MLLNVQLEVSIKNYGKMMINKRSEFSIKIHARPLVKIDNVIFIYVMAPHSESAVLAITHENRALLQMASRFAQIGEEEIPQIISALLKLKFLVHCAVRVCVYL